MRRTSLLVLASGILLLLVLLGTDPTRITSIGLVLPFALLFVILMLLCARVFEKRGFSQARSLRMGGFLAGLPVILLIFQSIGQLTPRDLITILALFMISYFYMTRAHARVE